MKNVYAELDAQHKEHRMQFPRDRSLGPRASEIDRRLVDLRSIEAVLTSNYMVKGWLGRNCLSMLYGPSNAGKTFVALDLAMHVASGKPWRGYRVNGGSVLYIAAEGGAGVRNRLAQSWVSRDVSAPHLGCNHQLTNEPRK